MNEIVVLSGAEEDLFIHYCEQMERGEDHTLRMNADITHMYRLLAQNPLLGSRYDKRARKLIVKNWNLGIFYAVVGSRNMILAVQHLHQSPKKIRAILKSRMPR
ncbi:hypothetical protein [Prosthecobacter sp.]|uniref:hypothetical protein n=1 Tax=Prosthecobacter sp. TaxID=1965333 RepID=UPI003784068E